MFRSQTHWSHINHCQARLLSSTIDSSADQVATHAQLVLQQDATQHSFSVINSRCGSTITTMIQLDSS